MPNIDELIAGRRYTFREKNAIYRGKILEIKIIGGNTMIYILTDEIINHKILTKIRSLESIRSIETLDEILRQPKKIPKEVIDIIDSYL